MDFHHKISVKINQYKSIICLLFILYLQFGINHPEIIHSNSLCFTYYILFGLLGLFQGVLFFLKKEYPILSGISSYCLFVFLVFLLIESVILYQNNITYFLILFCLSLYASWLNSCITNESSKYYKENIQRIEKVLKVWMG